MQLNFIYNYREESQPGLNWLMLSIMNLYECVCAWTGLEEVADKIEMFHTLYEFRNETLLSYRRNT